MEWVMVATLMAAVALVGLGFLAFWPAWPPTDDTPLPEEPKRPRRYRGNRRPQERLDGPEVPLPPERIDLAGPPLPMDATAQSWMWSVSQEAPRIRHRWENIGEGTQRLPPPPSPDWPPHNPIA